MTRATDSLADWFVGGAGKRALLRVLVDARPGAQFTQSQLADAAGLHEKGSVVRHLAILEQAGLVTRVSPGGPYRVERWTPRPDLRRWLAALERESGRSSSWTSPLPSSRGG